VDGAGTGEEALALMERRGKPYNVVLTDAVMPGMGGVELIRLLKGRGYAASLIMMTGYSEASDRLKAVTYGADVIAKPFTVEELVSTLRKSLPSISG
jgi:DNA-binding response OmpR family regulator